jgi:flagellar hook-length control protein FliK
MVETQINKSSSPSPTALAPKLSQQSVTLTSQGTGFSNMLQAFDSALSDTTQPRAAATAKANDDHAADNNTQDNQDDQSTQSEPRKIVNKSSKNNESVHHRATKQSQQTQSDHKDDASDPLVVEAKTLEQPIETSSFALAVAAAQVDEDMKPSDAHGKQPNLINLLAGQQATAPKTVASQKAMPISEEASAGKTVAATTTTTVAAVINTDETQAETIKDVAQSQGQATIKNDLPQQPQAGKQGFKVENLTVKPQGQEQDNATPQNQNTPVFVPPPVAAAPASNDDTQTRSLSATAAPLDNNNVSTPTPSSAPTLTASPTIATMTPTGKPVETTAQAQTRMDNNGLHMIDGGNRSLGSYANTTQLTAARSAQAAGLRATEVVEQVAVRLNQQAKSGLDQLTIQLRPADLGRIDVKLNFQDGAVTGTIIADSQSTLDLLVKDQRTLERALQDSGLRTDSGSLSFQLRDQNQQSGLPQERQTRAGKQDFNFDVTQSFDSTDSNESVAIMTADRVNLRV